MLVTPFLDDGEVDYESFGRLVDHMVAAGIRTVMHPGFASEYYKLSDDELTKLMIALLDRTRTIVGFTTVISIADHATHLAVRRAIAAVEAGATAINILPPHQLAPSPIAVREHVRAVAASVAGVPVVVQYAPALTGTALDAASISQMARDVPNVAQVKVESLPAGALITALAAQSPPLTSVVGYAGVQLIDALRRGAVGVQPGSAFAEIYLRIWSAWEGGRKEEAVILHSRLLPYISYWMQDLELFIAAEKRIATMRDLIASGHCRAPARQLDAEENAMIDRFFAEFTSELASDRHGAPDAPTVTSTKTTTASG